MNPKREHLNLLVDYILEMEVEDEPTPHPFKINDQRRFEEALKTITGRVLTSEQHNAVSIKALTEHEDEVAKTVVKLMRLKGWM